MTVNWKLMIQLRERQRTEASEQVAQERKVVAESEAQVQTLQGQLRQERDAKAALWRQATAAIQEGTGSVEQLKYVTSYSRILDAKAAKSAAAVQEAQGEMQKKMVVLEQRRQVLRQAMGDLEKAKEMQLRQLKGQQKRMENRVEDVVDEWTSQKWLSQVQH